MLSQKFRPAILLIVCDTNISWLLQKNFLETEFTFNITYNPDTGVQKALSNRYDIILIDFQNAAEICFEVLNRIRAVNKELPVIILGQKDGTESEINTYKYGGNLFHSKPPSFALLEAEVKQLLFYKANNLLVSMGDIEIDLTSRIIRRKEEEINLTKSEFNFLLLLIKNPRRVITREKIISDILNYNKDVEYAAVDTMVSRIRKKLSQHGDQEVIDTVVKIGYRLNPMYVKSCKIKQHS